VNKKTTKKNLFFPFFVQIRIVIQDENDNTPEFTDTDQFRSFSVPETAQINTRLSQVIAVDRDAGLNGQIVYSLRPDTAVLLGGKRHDFISSCSIISLSFAAFAADHVLVRFNHLAIIIITIYFVTPLGEMT
jgi:hypothetical protein